MYFTSYERTNTNGGLNIRIGTGSKENPAFEIPYIIEGDRFNGILTVTAWANSRNNGSFHWTHTDYDIFNRDIYAGVYYTVGDQEQFQQIGPRYCDTTNDYANQTIQNIQFNLSEFGVPENATVTKIIIWSTMSSKNYNEQWRIKEGATNYRAIELKLN